MYNKTDQNVHCGISSTHDSEETCAMQSIKDGPDSFQLIICSFYKNKDHFSCPKLAIVSLLFTMVFFFHLLIYFKFWSNVEHLLKVGNDIFVIIHAFPLSQLAVCWTPENMALAINVSLTTITFPVICFVLWVICIIEFAFEHFRPQWEFQPCLRHCHFLKVIFSFPCCFISQLVQFWILFNTVF